MSLKQEPNYCYLAEDELSFPSEVLLRRRCDIGWPAKIIVTVLVLVSLGMGFVFAQTLSQVSTVPAQVQHLNSSMEQISCGTTSEQASTTNCTYDYLAHLWLPPTCNHQDLPSTPDRNHMYLHAGPNSTQFSYFLDAEGLYPVDIATQPYHTGIFSSVQEHLAHCAFTLLRTSDWMRHGGMWERKVLSPDHMEHCVMLLYNASIEGGRDRLDSLDSFTYLGFGGGCYADVQGRVGREPLHHHPKS